MHEQRSQNRYTGILVKSEFEQRIIEWWSSRTRHLERGSEPQFALGLVEISGLDPVRLLQVLVQMMLLHIVDIQVYTPTDMLSGYLLENICFDQHMVDHCVNVYYGRPVMLSTTRTVPKYCQK